MTELAFRCRGCGALMVKRERGYRCPECSEAVLYDEGILGYDTDEFYYGEVSQSEMLELLECYRQQDSKAVVRFIRERFPDKHDWLLPYVFDRRRGAWVHLLDGCGHEAVLDCGCGWGTLSIELSKFFRHVVAADRTLERLRFAQLRASEEGIDNIQFVRGFAATHLPFPDGSFDLVVLNGVLEYVGASTSDPGGAQAAFLKEVWRVLRKSGVCYIGIENRWSYHYLRGVPDHSGLKYAAFMPRPIASLYSRWVKGEPYTTYVYTASGYRRLLARAGFRKTVFYAANPSYRHPSALVPLRSAALKSLLGARNPNGEVRLGVRKYLKRKLSWTLNGVGLFKQFIPHFAIYATK